MGPAAPASVGPFRRASVPGGAVAITPPGMDAGRNGPRDVERSETP
jgi:hypothetical protein